jgi:SAM-dependent methyltransferase
MSGYDADFYGGWSEITRTSAAEVVRLVMDLVGPRSVCDVGCGSGLWLQAFREAGVASVRGLDGPWVDPASLPFGAEHFEAVDMTRPFTVGGRYDLAMSLEVGEHLPPSRADGLVEALTDAAPVVLFSAAIPHQGGVRHINEQWPGYWVERFAARGFVVLDAIRPTVWEDERVADFYRQNIGLYVAREALDRYPALDGIEPGRFPALVHPHHYLNLIEGQTLSGTLADTVGPRLGPLRPLAGRVRRALRR